MYKKLTILPLLACMFWPIQSVYADSNDLDEFRSKLTMNGYWLKMTV
jgi:hypothetical protein